MEKTVFGAAFMLSSVKYLPGIPQEISDIIRKPVPLAAAERPSGAKSVSRGKRNIFCITFSPDAFFFHFLRLSYVALMLCVTANATS
ncbi:hypothetical protein [Enterobacter roggenkampii]|uniref:hypothetical protein n=1 Tax=Enterobacter roggenkampii TaxID=1812935 RepID=UPI001D096E97|nr:hypothetical protein [Enterobacter roggenkampii]